MTTEQRVARMVLLSSRIAKYQAEFVGHKEIMRKMEQGKYWDSTVYSVRSTNVRAYSRRGFIAVRVKRR